MKTQILKSVLTVMILGFLFNSVNAQETYKIDTKNSSMNWFAEKVTGEHFGTVALKSGSFVMKNNKIESGTFDVDMTTITVTDVQDAGVNGKLLGHLKSDDFFSVATHPVAKFVITGSDSFDKGNAFVRGNLTIKGITQPITFRATLDKKTDVVKIYAVVIVDRTKFDVKYGSGNFFDNLGDKTIYDEFKLKLNLTATK